ncbi:MAG TPA: hypothetical protein VFS20_03305 [Longimicrobium sp.]|nr:hypothetical protein [Longimicrobium sp.]
MMRIFAYQGVIMYCHNCGTKAEGRFCWKCGTRLDRGPGAGAVPAGQTGALPGTPNGGPLDLPAVGRSAAARELVGRYAAQATRRMSGEEFLQAFDRPFKAAVGIPISPIAMIAQPIYARMGVQTGKERVATIPRPPADTFVAILCSLARNGQLVRALHAGTDGCVIEAVLPSDMWAFEGTILITLRQAGPGTEVRASTVIKGQLFDWGKSNACLEALLTDAHNIPVMI